MTSADDEWKIGYSTVINKINANIQIMIRGPIICIYLNKESEKQRDKETKNLEYVFEVQKISYETYSQ